MTEETWKRSFGEALMVSRAAIQGVIAHPNASQEDREKALGVALNALSEIEDACNCGADSEGEKGCE